MAMDQNNFVAPGPGGYVVYVNGQPVGTYTTQGEAERAYNTATGQSNAIGGPAGAGGSGFPSMVGGTGQLPAYLQGIDKDLARDIYGNIQLPGFQWGQQQDLWNRALQGSNLSGYMPSGNWWAGMQQSSSGGTPAGGYNTKNGAKTLQQMEAELKAAGWPGGEDVATAYARTTGGAVTPGGQTQGTQASNQASQPWLPQMTDWYKDFQQRTGQKPTPEEWVQGFTNITGESAEAGAQMRDWGAQFMQNMGRMPTNDEWMKRLQQINPQAGQTRTLPGQMFDASKQQWQDVFDRSGTQWDKKFGEDRRQFDTTASGWMGGEQGRGATLDRERMYGDLMSRLSGPQDWVKYQIAQSGMPEGSLGSLQEVMARTPSFGAVRPTESYEQKMAQLYANLKQGKQQGGGDYNTLPMPGAVPLDERLLEQNFLPQQIPGRPNTGPRPGQTAENNFTTQVQPNMWQGMQQGGAQAQQGGNVNDLMDRSIGLNEPGRRYIGPRPGQTADGNFTTQVQPNMWQGMQQGGAQAQQGGNVNDLMDRSIGLNEPGRRYIGPPVSTREQGGNATQNWMQNVTQPTQITPQMFNKMTPSQKQMQTGLWSAQGIAPEDAWEKMKRAFPSGQANTRTVWK